MYILLGGRGGGGIKMRQVNGPFLRKVGNQHLNIQYPKSLKLCEIQSQIKYRKKTSLKRLIEKNNGGSTPKVTV